MRKMSFSIWLLVVCAAALLSTLQTTTGQDVNPLKKLSTAIASFSYDLMIELINSNPLANTGFSATCIYIAMAMLYAGSAGETKAQLAKALYLDSFEDDEEFYDMIKNLLQALSSTQKGYTLKMVNRLYAEKGFQFNDDYLTKLSDYFNTKPEELDFSGDPSGSTTKINKWVARMTSDKIRQLFPKGIIASDTHIAMAGAFSFSAPWLYKFEKKNTKLQAFYTAANKKIQVPTMNMPTAVLGYLKKPDFELLALPHAGRKVITVIIMMNKNATISTLQRRVVIDTTGGKVIDRPKNLTVKLSLPKFTLNGTVNLKSALKGLGITAVFDEATADITDIDTEHSVPVSESMHQTFISVNEDGKQSIGISGGNIRRLTTPSIVFNVDRPFFIGMYDKATESCLFSAYVVNPLKTK